MIVKTRRTSYSNLELELNDIGYENVLKIIATPEYAYTVGNGMPANEAKYTIIYKVEDGKKQLNE